MSQSGSELPKADFAGQQGTQQDWNYSTTVKLAGNASSSRAFRSSGVGSTLNEPAVKETAPRVPSPLTVLLAQHPHGFRVRSPCAQATAQRISKLSAESTLKEMSEHLHRRNGLSHISQLEPVPEQNDRKDDISPDSKHDTLLQTGEWWNGSKDSGGTNQFGRRSTIKLSESQSKLGKMGSQLKRQSTRPLIEGRQTRASLIDGTPQCRGGLLMAGTRGSIFKLVADTATEAPAPTLQPSTQSTQEILDELRSEGKAKVESRSRQLAALGRPGAPGSTKPQRSSFREFQSEPSLLLAGRHDTDAARQYRDEMDRLLHRIMTDVDISHSQMPAKHAQIQVCRDLDKAHHWFQRHQAVGIGLEQSAGLPKPSRVSAYAGEAGLRIPEGSPALPGSLRWERHR
eukprot:TRINITY_DN21403_c0_g1_i1.p1 TRINITY_DN21403_c0_g1~~TRINITY_DN21403_c0_g1_i1.p1  ORF type:complete len:407 (-),score=66.91 TRINITY_DN21403_c0_g1_i1:6-1205(-)